MRVGHLIQPAPFTLICWTGYLCIYNLAPLSYDEGTSARTWLFIASCLVIYIMSAMLGRVPLRKTEGRARVVLPDPILADSVFWCTVIGMTGVVCMLVDKLMFSGLDYGQGIGAVRMMRAQGVLLGEDVVRTPLIYVAWIAISFSNVAYILYWLYSERLSWLLRGFVQLSLISPLAFSALYGGRFPLIMVILLAITASFVRKACGLRAIPRDIIAVSALGIFGLMTVVYSGYALADRIRYLSNADVGHYEIFYAVRGVDVSPGLKTFQEASGVPPWLVGQLLQPVWYAVIPTRHLDLAIRHRDKWSPCFGQYQVPLVSTLFGVVAPKYDVRARMLKEHQDAEFYGVYLTAWGGWLIDFGFIGAFAGVGVLGWLSGRVFRRLGQKRDPGSLMLAVYILASVVLSPFMALYSIANGIIILMAIVVVGWRMKRSIRRHSAMGDMALA